MVAQPSAHLVVGERGQTTGIRARVIKMKDRLFAISVAAAGVFLVPVLVLAHHSEANFDMRKQITLRATVTDFKFINPHPYVYFQAKDEAGKVVEWIAESGSTRATWYNSGWRTNALKAGDAITITGSPSRDGRDMLRIRKIVNPSGQEWTE